LAGSTDKTRLKPDELMKLQGALLLVGCGKMGGALLDGWLRDGLAAGQVTVVEPWKAAAEGIAKQGVTVLPTLDAVAADLTPEVVVLAVKPQAMDTVMPDCARFVAPETVFLSIAAGKTIAYFQDALGGQAAVVRAMTAAMSPASPCAKRFVIVS